MTELEIMQRAKMYMDQLAQGIDPISGQELPEDSTLNNVRLTRCFFYVSGVLEQVIANGGRVGAVEKKEFAITAQQLAMVQLTEHPIRITEFTGNILRATGDPLMKQPSAAKFSKWLEIKGFVEKVPEGEGKYRRVPTAQGLRLGLSSQMRQSSDGEYLAIYYDANAQRFLLDHLFDVLQTK